MEAHNSANDDELVNDMDADHATQYLHLQVHNLQVILHSSSSEQVELISHDISPPVAAQIPVNMIVAVITFVRYNVTIIIVYLIQKYIHIIFFISFSIFYYLIITALLYGSLWFLMVPYGSLWLLTVPYSSFQILKFPIRSFYNHFAYFCFTQVMHIP